MLDILPPIVEGFSANLLAYAVLLAAIATITMALLELVKAVSRARLSYHRSRAKAWIDSSEAYEQLLILAASDVESAAALFDQPTDKMMGQIQSAANVALDFPDTYKALYEFLTRMPKSPEAPAAAVGEPPVPDPEVWRRYSKLLDQDRKPDDSLPAGAQAATRARARLDHFVTRKLDAFQTRTEYIWARTNQLVSVIGCSVFIVAIIDASNLNVSPTQTFFLAAFGGMLAPFAKDVVTALTNLRARV